MHRAERDLKDAATAHKILTEAQAASFLPAEETPPAGTVCQIILRLGEYTLELFALAKSGGYLLTDEPADLKFQIGRFLAEAAPEPALEGAAAPQVGEGTVTEGEAPADLDAGLPGDEEMGEEGEEIDPAELNALQSETGSKDPLLAELKRIRALQLPQKIRLAEDGDLTQRTLLYRMYGKLVFDALLRNPRITETEVAKLAKLATIGVPQLQVIVRRADWVRSERVRNALLGNTRLPQAMAQKIIGMLGRHELKPLLQRRDFPPQIQAALKDAHWKLANR